MGIECFIAHPAIHGPTMEGVSEASNTWRQVGSYGFWAKKGVNLYEKVLKVFHRLFLRQQANREFHFLKEFIFSRSRRKESGCCHLSFHYQTSIFQLSVLSTKSFEVWPN